MPHWPTATTRRSPCVAALLGTARLRTRTPAPSACRNLRRFIGCNMRCLLPGRLLDGRPMAGDTNDMPRYAQGTSRAGGLALCAHGHSLGTPGVETALAPVHPSIVMTDYMPLQTSGPKADAILLRPNDDGQAK